MKDFKRLNTYLFFIGIFATILVIEISYNSNDTIAESSGTAAGYTLLVFIAYRLGKWFFKKDKPKDKTKQAI